MTRLGGRPLDDPPDTGEAKALSFATRASAVARDRDERLNEAWAHQLLGEVVSRMDAPDNADGHYRRALSLARGLGMRPLAAHCHLGLGKLYHRTDKREEAREHLTTATTMYREMDMSSWLAQADWN